MKAYVIRWIMEEPYGAPRMFNVVKGGRAFPVCDGYAQKWCFTDEKTAQRVCSRYNNEHTDPRCTFRVVEVNVDESIKTYRDMIAWRVAHSA